MSKSQAKRVFEQKNSVSDKRKSRKSRKLAESLPEKCQVCGGLVTEWVQDYRIEVDSGIEFQVPAGKMKGYCAKHARPSKELGRLSARLFPGIWSCLAGRN